VGEEAGSRERARLQIISSRPNNSINYYYRTLKKCGAQASFILPQLKSDKSESVFVVQPEAGIASKFALAASPRAAIEQSVRNSRQCQCQLCGHPRNARCNARKRRIRSRILLVSRRFLRSPRSGVTIRRNRKIREYRAVPRAVKRDSVLFLIYVAPRCSHAPRPCPCPCPSPRLQRQAIDLSFPLSLLARSCISRRNDEFSKRKPTDRICIRSSNAAQTHEQRQHANPFPFDGTFFFFDNNNRPPGRCMLWASDNFCLTSKVSKDTFITTSRLCFVASSLQRSVKRNSPCASRPFSSTCPLINPYSRAAE